MNRIRISAVLGVVAICLAFAAQAMATKYVALGDSYSSGTGRRTFYEPSCQRSVYAYPYLLHEAHPSWTFVDAAGAGGNHLVAAQLAGVKRHLGNQLGEVNNAIKSHAPNAKVIVLDYPRLFNGEDCNALSNPTSESYHPKVTGHASGYYPVVHGVTG